MRANAFFLCRLLKVAGRICFDADNPAFGWGLVADQLLVRKW